MKYQQKLLFLILSIMVINSAQSQNFIFGASANLGLSKVTTNSPISEEYKLKFTGSGNLGMFAQNKLGKNSYMLFEILWVQIEGKEVVKDKTLQTFNGQGLQVIGVVSNKSRLHSSYLGVPISYRHEFRKIGMRAGIQTMIFLFASSNYESKGVINNMDYEEKSETKGIKFDRIDMGPKLGIDYQLNKTFRLRVDYYYGVIDITSDDFPWQKRNQQISMGIDYTFGIETE